MIKPSAFATKKERKPNNKRYPSQYKTHATVEMKVACDCGLRVTYHIGPDLAQSMRFDLMRKHAGHKLVIKTGSEK